jgi:hypothetical protein
MVTSTEPVMALTYVQGVLRADLTLTALNPSISVGDAETGAAYPRVVIDAPDSGPDLNALQDGGARIEATPRVYITVISANRSFAAIDAVAARIDTLLHGGGGIAVNGGLIVTFERDRAYAQSPLEENGFHANIVLRYSTTVRAAT